MKFFSLILVLVPLLFLLSNACSNHDFSPSAVDLDADSDMDMDADSDGDGDNDTDSDTSADEGTDTNMNDFDTDTITPERCLDNTESEARCLDCCDCMNSDCGLRSSCRDQCTGHNFSNNSDILVFDAPSDQGATGDYQACFLRGDRQECLICCDCATIYACGDYKYCRAVCAQIF